MYEVPEYCTCSVPLFPPHLGRFSVPQLRYPSQGSLITSLPTHLCNGPLRFDSASLHPNPIDSQTTTSIFSTELRRPACPINPEPASASSPFPSPPRLPHGRPPLPRPPLRVLVFGSVQQRCPAFMSQPAWLRLFSNHGPGGLDRHRRRSQAARHPFRSAHLARRPQTRAHRGLRRRDGVL